MSNPSDSPAPARHANGRFGPGNPGRRAGARGRASHRVVMAILQDFELNKTKVLETLRHTYPPAYFAVLNRMLDRELKVEAPSFDDYSDAELATMVREARFALNGSAPPRVALLELEGALLNQTSLDPADAADRN